MVEYVNASGDNYTAHLPRAVEGIFQRTFLAKIAGLGDPSCVHLASLGVPFGIICVYSTIMTFED